MAASWEKAVCDPWTHLENSFHSIKQLLAFESVPVLDNEQTILSGLMLHLAVKGPLLLQWEVLRDSQPLWLGSTPPSSPQLNSCDPIPPKPWELGQQRWKTATPQHLGLSVSPLLTSALCHRLSPGTHVLWFLLIDSLIFSWAHPWMCETKTVFPIVICS